MIYSCLFQNDAIDYFEEICKSIYFDSASIVILLSDRDKFVEKLKTVHIHDIPEFKRFKGAEGDANAAEKFFVNKFIMKNPNQCREICIHVCNKVDKKLVNTVFSDCTKLTNKKNSRDDVEQ